MTTHLPTPERPVHPEGETMSTSDYRRTVTTQVELNTALSDGVHVIHVRSDPDEWLTVRDAGVSAVSVQGSSAVRAMGHASVEVTGSATVEAWDNAIVRAWDDANVEARDSATVEAWDDANVEARDSAIVEAWDNAVVRAWSYSRVEAGDSSTVTAWGSATVKARGSASVKAWGYSRVAAWDSATVKASSHVAVHLHSGRTTVTGGVVIDHTQEPSDPVAWCAWHDVPVIDGKALLHKAIGDDWTTGATWDYRYRPVYAPGAELEAPDWRDDHDCGGGLHFSPRTWEARSYHLDATRFVAVEVDVADLRPILGSAPKAKAPRCRVLHEVDLDGEPVGGESDE